MNTKITAAESQHYI